MKKIITVTVLAISAFGLYFVTGGSQETLAQPQSQTFSAGVVAAEMPMGGTIEVLGKFKSCHLQSYEKYSEFNSACYIYKNDQQVWVVESVNAVCRAVCE
jgi:hypothetical protein